MKKVAPIIKGITGGNSTQVAVAQTAARSIVQNINGDGLAQLPKFNAGQLKSLGFDINSFAQMDADNLNENDMKQVLLLGLADEDLSKTM